MWHCLVLLSILYCVLGLDELFIDLYFWIHCIWHKKSKPVNALIEAWETKTEKWIAVLIPCWHEANVIATMLQHNYHTIEYKHYYFFVGVYPNDPATVLDVLELSHHLPKVQCVIGQYPGPTNKATNLNIIYQYIKVFEQQENINFDLYVLHDAEDIIHPLSFKVYNAYIPIYDMIQLPVLPLAVAHSDFTHWLYADEFAENHTKDILVRQWINAHVPSAGVGTAFSKHAINTLCIQSIINLPFATDSLTEDYRLSLILRIQGLKQAFIMQSVLRTQWQQRLLFKQRYVKKIVREPIATRALFPQQYKASVRQKARWIIGIVFQEWDLPFPKDWAVRYSLLHDRKAFITHFINAFGYVILLFWCVYMVVTWNQPDYPALQEQLNFHPWLLDSIILASILMVERLLQRMIALYRIYGWRPVILCIPRACYGNLLNLHALVRAYWIYFVATTQKNKAKVHALRWDKTEHEFSGSHVLVPYVRRLDELVILHTDVTTSQVYEILRECYRTGEHLGEALIRLNLITQDVLSKLMAMQYQLRLYSKSQAIAATSKIRDDLPKKLLRQERKYGICIIEFNARHNSVILGIYDPSNELLLKKIIRELAQYSIEFVLIG